MSIPQYVFHWTNNMDGGYLLHERIHKNSVPAYARLAKVEHYHGALATSRV